MQLHHRIIHHVRKHKEKLIAHVNKHHKKYLVGAGVLSGITIYKVILLMLVFLGVSQMGGNLGADYYDTQWDALQTGKINISNIIDTNTITEESGENIPLISGAELTGKDTTGESTSAK